MEKYRKIDDNNLEITTVSKHTRDKFFLLTEKEQLQRQITQNQEEISKINSQLDLLKGNDGIIKGM